MGLPWDSSAMGKDCTRPCHWLVPTSSRLPGSAWHCQAVMAQLGSDGTSRQQMALQGSNATSRQRWHYQAVHGSARQ